MCRTMLRDAVPSLALDPEIIAAHYKGVPEERKHGKVKIKPSFRIKAATSNVLTLLDEVDYGRSKVVKEGETAPKKVKRRTVKKGKNFAEVGLVTTGRSLGIQRQAHDLGYRLIGIQEARTEGPGIRECKDYYIVSSGASRNREILWGQSRRGRGLGDLDGKEGPPLPPRKEFCVECCDCDNAGAKRSS